MKKLVIVFMYSVLSIGYCSIFVANCINHTNIINVDLSNSVIHVCFLYVMHV